jgi:hypothetical protein
MKGQLSSINILRIIDGEKLLSGPGMNPLRLKFGSIAWKRRGRMYFGGCSHFILLSYTVRLYMSFLI